MPLSEIVMDFFDILKSKSQGYASVDFVFDRFQKADLVIGELNNDHTTPTFCIPQQFPHNPGGIGYGSLWNYQQVIHNKDFWVWSFIYDVSGIESADCLLNIQ